MFPSKNLLNSSCEGIFLPSNSSLVNLDNKNTLAYSDELYSFFASSSVICAFSDIVSPYLLFMLLI